MVNLIMDQQVTGTDHWLTWPPRFVDPFDPRPTVISDREPM